MITLRLAKDCDFDNYYALFCDIIAEKEYFSMENPFPKESSFAFRKDQEKIGRPIVVAYDNDKFIGWCDVFEGDANFSPKIGIGIHQCYRDQGLGKKLLLAIIDECKNKNISNLFLDVFKTNLRAISLYTNLGFKIIDSADYSALHNGIIKESYVMKLEIK